MHHYLKDVKQLDQLYKLLEQVNIDKEIMQDKIGSMIENLMGEY